MKRMNSKAVVLLITIAVLLTVTVGGTVAYLAASTPAVTNVFTPGSVPPHIIEELEDEVKQNVTVKNNGTVDAYIRAMIVVTWQDKDGNVYPAMPKQKSAENPDGHYEMSIGSDWTQETDGFYYYTGGDNEGKVGKDATTTALIVECRPVGTCPDTNYTLHVEIMAQAIQADGWPSTVTDAKSAFDAAAAGN